MIVPQDFQLKRMPNPVTIQALVFYEYSGLLQPFEVSDILGTKVPIVKHRITGLERQAGQAD